MSYLVPVRIRRKSSRINAVLDLYLYRGQWQLATADALYSDGDRYRPARLAFKGIKGLLPQVKTALILGTGLGSAAHIMHKAGCNAVVTLVDIDQEVLRLALELMPPEITRKANPVCADAAQFVAGDTHTYDLLFVDVFIGRTVPPFVLTEGFMQQCRRRLNSGGIFIFNYIINQEEEWQRLQVLLNTVFPGRKITENGINRIIVATV